MEKEKYSLEFLLTTSTKVLFNCLSTPSGLAEWFCDDVNVKNDIYHFEWDGSVEEAKCLSKKTNDSIKYQWLDDEDTDYYFEFAIKVDALTREVALIITDFAEEDELEESKMLWEKQVNKLKSRIGG